MSAEELTKQIRDWFLVEGEKPGKGYVHHDDDTTTTIDGEFELGKLAEHLVASPAGVVSELSLPRWLAVAAGADTVRLVPVPAPSTGPDVFCKLHAVEAAIAAAVAAERERCANLVDNACAYTGGHGEPGTPSGYELAKLIRRAA